MASEIKAICKNFHEVIIPVIDDAYVGSGYWNCNICNAEVIKRMVRRNENSKAVRWEVA